MDSFKSSPNPSSETYNYPGYYGGCYVNKEGKLVILISGNPKVHRKEFVQRCGSENIVLEKCKYPYVVLLNQMNRITEYHKNTPNNNIIGFGLIDNKNIIEIFLEDFNDDKILKLKQEIGNSPFFIFKKGEFINLEQSGANQLLPGDIVFNPSNAFSSFGYRAKLANDNTKVGMVVAGHSFKLNDNVIYNTAIIGKCIKRSFDGSKADASFAEIINQAFLPSNNISCGGVLSSVNKSVGINGVVYLCGANSDLQKGTVSSTSRTITTTRDGIKYTIYDLVEASYDSDYGDSGGIIFAIGTDNIRYTVGIHSGSDPKTNLAYYSKSSNVNQALSIVRY